MQRIDEWNDAEHRVKRGRKLIDQQRESLMRLVRELHAEDTIVLSNPMFKHAWDEVRTARELLARAVDKLDPEVVERHLAETYCVHCGREKKDPKSRYCSDTCERCGHSKRPEGMPCAMICTEGMA